MAMDKREAVQEFFVPTLAAATRLPDAVVNVSVGTASL